ncbi:MAG: hypothetical protein Q9164_003472 [Protoblastenia rupestris]
MHSRSTTNFLSLPSLLFLPALLLLPVLLPLLIVAKPILNTKIARTPDNVADLAAIAREEKEIALRCGFPNGDPKEYVKVRADSESETEEKLQCMASALGLIQNKGGSVDKSKNPSKREANPINEDELPTIEELIEMIPNPKERAEYMYRVSQELYTSKHYGGIPKKRDDDPLTQEEREVSPLNAADLPTEEELMTLFPDEAERTAYINRFRAQLSGSEEEEEEEEEEEDEEEG